MRSEGAGGRWDLLKFGDKSDAPTIKAPQRLDREHAGKEKGNENKAYKPRKPRIHQVVFWQRAYSGLCGVKQARDNNERIESSRTHNVFALLCGCFGQIVADLTIGSAPASL
jgi:hypothetical protein